MTYDVLIPKILRKLKIENLLNALTTHKFK